MITLKPSSRASRLTIVAPWLLLTALVGVASVPSFRALVLDAADKPTADVSLSSAHWTGTLDPARLPAGVPLLDAGHNLNVDGSLLGGSGVVTPQVYFPGGEPRIDLSDPATGVLRDGGADALEWTAAGIQVPGAINGGSFYANDHLIADAAGNLYAATLSDANGNEILYPDGSLNVFNQLSVSGDLCAYGDIYGYGSFFLQGSLIAYGGIYDAYGNTTLDPSGVLHAFNGIGLWGVSPPVSQPAAPTNFAEVISLLQAYGFCQ